MVLDLWWSSAMWTTSQDAVEVSEPLQELSKSLSVSRTQLSAMLPYTAARRLCTDLIRLVLSMQLMSLPCAYNTVVAELLGVSMQVPVRKWRVRRRERHSAPRPVHSASDEALVLAPRRRRYDV